VSESDSSRPIRIVGAFQSSCDRNAFTARFLNHLEEWLVRAITIKAPAEAVWPWLVPLGYGRGGFYSYDWIENLLMRVLRNGRPWRRDAWWPPRGCVPRVVGLAALGASPAT
jgi:hypothetical protein